MLQSIIYILHVLTCLMIVGLVLLQRGKGADAGTGFGAGASGTVFGARGSASFLSRATAALATTFFVTSLALAFFSNEPTAPESVLERSLPSQQQTAPEAVPPPEQDLEAPPVFEDNLPASDVPEVSVEPAPEAPSSGASDPELPPSSEEGNQ
jgi:preprotein translocase subunit SecG